MKKNVVKILFLVAVLAISVVVFTACNDGKTTDFTVSFNLNYKDAPAAETAKVASGSKATEPTAPSREHYAFGGWYKEAELTNLFDFKKETITKDTTLYAKWTQDYYYIAGNFTGYEPKLEGFNLIDVPNKEGWYYITVDLTAEARDATYDGHYYKITNGTWDAAGCWGADNYGFKPAPASPTGGGLGSIWIYDNCELTVYFDSVNKVVYDNYEQTFATPRIYGDFNAAMDRGTNWSIWDKDALTLSDADKDGIFTGLYKIPAYTGTAENGYSMAVATKVKYDTQWFVYGITEQYKFDGTAAGMGGVSYLKPDKETIYEFSYNGTTHITTVTAVKAGDVVNLSGPTVYGDFTGWVYEGGKAFVLTDADDDGIYTGTKTIAAYTGEGNGYIVAVALSKKLYDDQYGIRWGAETQYKLDGTAAGMGNISYFKPTAQKTYLFSYNSTTHVTTITEVV